jgi:hypothetical protein
MAVQLGFRQQGGGERSSRRRLAQAGLADEQVGMRETAGLELRSELVQGPRVSGDAGEGIPHESEL